MSVEWGSGYDECSIWPARSPFELVASASGQASLHCTSCMATCASRMHCQEHPGLVHVGDTSAFLTRHNERARAQESALDRRSISWGHSFVSRKLGPLLAQHGHQIMKLSLHSNNTPPLNVLAESSPYGGKETPVESLEQALAVAADLGLRTDFRSLAEAAWQRVRDDAHPWPGYGPVWKGGKVVITQLAGRFRLALAEVLAGMTAGS